jgi:N-acetylneuraminate synthase
MIITKNLLPYVVSKEASLKEALKKGHQNKVRTLFIVDANGLLYGTLSSGDVSKWLIAHDIADLSRSVAEACNTSCRYVRQGTSPKEIAAQFTKRIDVLPIVDNRGLLISLAFRDRKEIYIGHHKIGENHPAFIIAEIGNNHNGSIERAKKLVDQAVMAGADCAKFQLRDLSSLYSPTSQKGEDEDLGSQYVLDLLERFNLTPEQMFEIFDYCQEKDIVPLCTPWDDKSLEVLRKYGMLAYKVASADLTNHHFLAEIASTGRPMLVSTGMSTEAEIIKAIRLLNDSGAAYVLLHCNSTYPTPYKDVNLNYLSRLKELSQGPVGYSGHERGHSIPIAAVAMGARVIEKHLTLDCRMEGNDHKVSLEPDEFRSMVDGIRKVETACGKDETRQISQGEMINRESLAKSLIAAVSIPEGTVIARDMIKIKSPGKGLQPVYMEQLVGMRAKRDIGDGDFFYSSDIENHHYLPKSFQFDRPWGIPVRFHDLIKMTDVCDPDFVEFHLSYKDLELDPEKYVRNEHPMGFIVHAPELFEGDHILDLASADRDYFNQTLRHIGRVISITKVLKKYFPTTTKPMIVTNIGGFTQNGHLPSTERSVLYDRVREALGQIDQSGVELIAQTMPPFPWHFGGQRYHNLFVDHREIKQFYDDSGLRICLDISHSKLACNYYEWNFKEFIKAVGPSVAHMHIVDAKDIDKEGLQIGYGDIDFAYLGELLNKYCPGIGFIPEIWQGHKNSGEGFWMALTKLEQFL